MLSLHTFLRHYLYLGYHGAMMYKYGMKKGLLASNPFAMDGCVQIAILR